MRADEAAEAGFAENALPNVERATGIRPANLAFSIVPVLGRGSGFSVPYEVINNYIVARPLRFGSRPTADPERWWVFDLDVDETEGWIPQATFTPNGFIDYDGDEGDPPGGSDPPDGPGRVPCGCACHTNGREEGCMDCSCYSDAELDDLAEYARELMPVDPPPEPRNVNGPVTTTIDLDEVDQAKAEGIPAWEEHGHWHVLANDKGFAVIFDDPAGQAVGLIRYGDKTTTPMREQNIRVARETAEKWLASRPYKTAAERILDGSEFDAEDPVPEVEDTPTSPAVPRPTPPKRQWSTVPINSVDEDE